MSSCDLSLSPIRGSERAETGNKSLSPLVTSNLTEKRTIMATVEATEETFQSEVEESDLPVLVDFWAAWCGPCRALAPTLEAVSAEREGSLKVVKVNIDENPQLAEKFKIASIPNMILFKAGEPVHQIIGAVPKEFIDNELSGLV